MNLSQMASDLAYMISDLPVTVTVDGRSWTCTAGDLGGGMELDEGGLVELPSREYVGLVSGLAIVPTTASVVVDAGKTYRVVTVAKSADGLAWTLGVKGDWK